MKEIKFRAWDNVGNRFWYKDFFDRNWYTESNGGLCIQGLLPEDKYRLADVEQYTGLKDENGKEIYEGDILEYYLYHPPMDNLGKYESNDRCVGTVVFNNGQFKIDAGYRDILFRFDLHYLTEIMKIGNIHKNPELLEAVI